MSCWVFAHSFIEVVRVSPRNWALCVARFAIRPGRTLLVIGVLNDGGVNQMKAKVAARAGATMTPRAIATVSLMLGVLSLGCATTVKADTLFTLSITYSLDAVTGGQLTGNAQFFTTNNILDTTLDLTGPISIGSLSPGSSFSTRFIPTEPCLGLFVTSCSIGFSFSGTANTSTALAFLNFTDAPSTVPPTPILPVTDNLIPSDPCVNGTVCEVSGAIVAYDSPVQVGTFEVTISQTPIPAALPLFATGLGGLGLLGWRRKRKAQAVA
jgi:hypothetical protein